MIVFKYAIQTISMYWSTFLGMILIMLLVGMYGYACRVCIWGVQYEYVENRPVHNDLSNHYHRGAIVHPIDA
jgi:hypothetical protein